MNAVRQSSEPESLRNWAALCLCLVTIQLCALQKGQRLYSLFRPSTQLHDKEIPCFELQNLNVHWPLYKIPPNTPSANLQPVHNLILPLPEIHFNIILSMF
jgi:hypothetical protein